MKTVPILELAEGREYAYTSDSPKGRRGHRYRLVQFVLDVPSYAEKVLVQALTGPDKGLLFVVSPWNFATRYASLEDEREPDPQPPERVAGAKEGSWV